MSKEEDIKILKWRIMVNERLKTWTDAEIQRFQEELALLENEEE